MVALKRGSQRVVIRLMKELRELMMVTGNCVDRIEGIGKVFHGGRWW